MEFENFVRALRDKHAQRPFRQYEIELSSGSLFRVTHPDLLAFSGRCALVITPDGNTHHFDHDSVVRITETTEPAEKVGPSIKL